jgi:hypothetical protein
MGWSVLTDGAEGKKLKRAKALETKWSGPRFNSVCFGCARMLRTDLACCVEKRCVETCQSALKVFL